MTSQTFYTNLWLYGGISNWNISYTLTKIHTQTRLLKTHGHIFYILPFYYYLEWNLLSSCILYKTDHQNTFERGLLVVMCECKTLCHTLRKHKLQVLDNRRGKLFGHVKDEADDQVSITALQGVVLRNS